MIKCRADAKCTRISRSHVDWLLCLKSTKSKWRKLTSTNDLAFSFVSMSKGKEEISYNFHLSKVKSRLDPVRLHWWSGQTDAATHGGDVLDVWWKLTICTLPEIILEMSSQQNASLAAIFEDYIMWGRHEIWFTKIAGLLAGSWEGYVVHELFGCLNSVTRPSDMTKIWFFWARHILHFVATQLKAHSFSNGLFSKVVSIQNTKQKHLFLILSSDSVPFRIPWIILL